MIAIVNGDVVDVEKRVGAGSVALTSPHADVRLMLQTLFPHDQAVVLDAQWFAPPAKEPGPMGVRFDARGGGEHGAGELLLQSQCAPDASRLDALMPRDQRRAFTARWVGHTQAEQDEERARLEKLSDKELIIECTRRNVVWKTLATRGKEERGVNVDALVGANVRLLITEGVAGSSQTGQEAPEVDPVDLAKTRLRQLSQKDLQTLCGELEVKWDREASLDTMLGRIAEAQIAQGAGADA